MLSLMINSQQYLMNHFLDVNTTLFGQTIPVPDTARLLETHASSGAAPAMSAQADQCFSNHGYYPTFTLVDYYDVGNGSVFGQFSPTFSRYSDERRRLMVEVVE